MSLIGGSLPILPFDFAHESSVLRWIGPPLVPQVLAAEAGKMLLADVPGHDLYGAGLEMRRAIAKAFHPVQVSAIRDLPLSGVPDERGHALIEPIDVTRVAPPHKAFSFRSECATRCKSQMRLAHQFLA